MTISPISLIRGLRRIRVNIEDHSIWHRFRRNVSISMAGSGLSLAIKLAQTALLTRVLKIEDYGRLLIVLNLFVFLDSFFGLRVNDVMFRFFPPLREAKDARALKGLVLLGLGTCLASGILIYGGVLALSPWLADRLYPGLEMGTLFAIYGITILVSAFAGVYEPILRMNDRFLSVVRPQVLGNLITFVLLCIYFSTNLASGFPGNADYDLRAVVAFFTIGALVQTLPSFVQALRLVRPILVGVKAREAIHALRSYRRALTACFLNSNLSNCLKFATSPGDIFVLGIFSSPTQLAFYGLAKQLTAPLALLLFNVQTSVTPEITALVARKRFEQLKRLVVSYVWSTLVVGSLLLAGTLLVGHLLLSRWVQPEYLAALPVFYVIATVVWLMLVFLVFRPVAVSLDLLKWHNLALFASACLVGLLIVAGGLNALTMAYVQLAEILVFRSMFNLLIWTRLKRLAATERIANIPGQNAPSEA